MSNHARIRPGSRSSPQEGVLQARAADRPSGQHLARAGRGRPLPDAVRAKMERALGHDFSRVRIHEGGQAESLGAVAYARGTDLHFAPGRYSPSTRGGQELIGHELAHVVQQQAGRVAVPPGNGAPINADPALEAEADRLGAAAAATAGPASDTGSTPAPAAAEAAMPIQRNGNGKGKKKKSGGARKRTARRDSDSDSDSDYEEESDPEPEDEEERRLNEIGYGLDLGPGFSVVTSNVEKFGRGTERGRRDDKIEELSRVVSQSAPTLATFQEVTNPDLFGHGQRGSHGLVNQPLPGGGTLGGQYGYLPGPSFQSGNYRESYPLLADTGVVHDPPKLSYFPGNKTTPKAYGGQTLRFGKAVDPKKKDPRSARPTTFWTVKVPSGRYNLRPPTKGWGSLAERRRYARLHRNLKHRNIDYESVNLLNVHTSPSISTITKQAAQIRAQHEALARDNPATLSAGDWYLQNSAKQTWSRFQRSDTLSLDEPGVQTNFPGKGTGQTADHFVSTRAGLTPGIVRALPRPTLESQEENLSLEDYLREQAPVEDLEEWTGVGIDHAPVYGYYDIRRRGGGPVRNRRQRRYSPY